MAALIVIHGLRPDSFGYTWSLSRGKEVQCFQEARRGPMYVFPVALVATASAEPAAAAWEEAGLAAVAVIHGVRLESFGLYLESLKG